MLPALLSFSFFPRISQNFSAVCSYGGNHWIPSKMTNSRTILVCCSPFLPKVLWVLKGLTNWFVASLWGLQNSWPLRSLEVWRITWGCFASSCLLGRAMVMPWSCPVIYPVSWLCLLSEIASKSEPYQNISTAWVNSTTGNPRFFYGFQVQASTKRLL